MQYVPRWLFQATADRYDLRTEFMEGKGECWPSIQHRDTPYRLGEDQRVIFFRAGSREFYGIGRILSVTKMPPSNTWTHKRCWSWCFIRQTIFPSYPASSQLPS